MSLHPSLKTSKAGKKHRSVLKRFEKFFTLKEKGILKDDSSVFSMPKLKIVRTKVKKEKAEEKPEEAQAAAPEAQAAAPEAQGTAQKEAAPKAVKKTDKKEEKKK